MNTEEIFKQSGYTIPTDKHDECSKRFDYWDMIAFADLVIEKQKEQDSNLSQHLVSIMLRCTDDSVGNVTIDNEYKLIVESKRHYNIIDDNGNDVLISKSYFDKIN